MNVRHRVLKELEIQESILGSVKNKNLIIKILNSCKSTGEFYTFVKIDFHRYGKMSYETHRFYSIKEHLLPLLIKT